MYGAFGSNALAMFIYVFTLLFTGPFEEDNKISSDSNFLRHFFFFIKPVYVKIENLLGYYFSIYDLILTIRMCMAIVQ